MATLDRTRKDSDEDTDTIAERIRDFPRIEKALRQGVLNAAQVHKITGVPMVIRRDGELVEVPAEEVEAEILAEERSRS